MCHITIKQDIVSLLMALRIMIQNINGLNHFSTITIEKSNKIS